uniref:Uncharacterized protein n=1 Tax=Lepeophtheirus salmonis TaxID=72036 RepID=A0A0K2V938_LEPSM
MVQYLLKALSLLILGSSIIHGSPTDYGSSRSNGRIVFGEDTSSSSLRSSTVVKGRSGTGCRLVNKVVYDVEYEEVNNQVCKTTNKRVCNTRFVEDCKNYQDQVCETVQRRECNNKRERQCEDFFRTVSEPYIEDECRDESVRECEKAWQVNGAGEKIWADDPSTCIQVKKTKCSPVTKQRSRQVPDQICLTVTVPVCQNVPKQECRSITKKRCEKKPVEECNNVPRRNCQNVHKQVPKQVKKNVQVRECNEGSSSIQSENKFTSGGSFDVDHTNDDDSSIILENDYEDSFRDSIGPRSSILL